MWLPLVSPVRAEGAPATRAGDVVLQNFRFESGETLPSLRLHYLTLGTPRRDTTGAVGNAVLLLHGTTRTADSFLQPRFFEALFGPGKPLDLDRTFLIIPDAIGGGGSSKPSDGLHVRFPRYGYKDQVRAQHDMLARIGVDRLRLVLGVSMGGMETWLWAETHPKDADGFVAIACMPASVSGRNRIWREIVSQAIRNDPDWKGGDYPKDKPPRNWLRVAIPLFTIMTTNADVMQKRAPTRRAAIDLVNTLAEREASRDANDTLYRFESSFDYDPVAKLDTIVRPLLSINFADDLLNPPDLLRLPTGGMVTSVIVPKGPKTLGHETIAHPEVWAPDLATFLRALPTRP